MPRRSAVRKPALRFATEREAVDRLAAFYTLRIKLSSLRAEVRKLEAEEKTLVEAYDAYFDGLEPGVEPILRDPERETMPPLQREARRAPDVVALSDMPADLLTLCASLGLVRGLLTPIRQLPESANRDRIMRFVVPGGESTRLVFAGGDEEEAE